MLLLLSCAVKLINKLKSVNENAEITQQLSLLQVYYTSYEKHTKIMNKMGGWTQLHQGTLLINTCWVYFAGIVNMAIRKKQGLRN